MDLIVPAAVGNPYAVPELAVEIWIGGRRRSDAYCREYAVSAGAGAGRATIEFSPGLVSRVYDQYDMALALENDLVEIVVRPWGTVWRGTMVGRASRPGVSYEARELLGKLNDVFFPHEYNYVDEIVRERKTAVAVAARKYAWTARQIAADAYDVYTGWKTGHADDDFLLGIDLETFPEIVPPSETRIMGQGLLAGLQQLLQTIDYRYRICVDHADDSSIVRAFLMGAGRKWPVTRGQDPAMDCLSQPGGPANVTMVDKRVDASATITHVLAEGEPRIIETAFELEPAWNEVANDFAPPEGHTLAEYVTEGERDLVISDWKRFTEKTLDLKIGDKDAAKVINPYYRKKYEDVCREYFIPLTDDTYYLNDDAETYPVMQGEAGRQVKIESGLVQQIQGRDLNHFVVYKRVGDDTLYVKTGGFTVHNSEVVRFDEPMVDTVSAIYTRGVAGAGLASAWNAGAKTSNYQVDTGIDLTDKISPAAITAGCWLLLGEMYCAPYKVLSRTADTLTVQGNVSGAGGVNTDGAEQKGAQWMVVSKDPVIARGTTGAGQALGNYRVANADLPDIPEINQYVGMFLIVATWDDTTQALTMAASDLKSYGVVCNIVSGAYTLLQTNAFKADLSGENAGWMLLRPRLEGKRAFECIELNASYQSLQRLFYFSGDLSALRNKSVVYKQSGEHKWLTQRGNYQLVPSTVAGEEDKYTAVKNEAVVDGRQDLSGLAAWALNQVAGATGYKINYSPLELRPIDFGLRLGDCPVDTGVDSGATVVGLSYDLIKQAVAVTAASWG
jgi:hypothetical protein